MVGDAERESPQARGGGVDMDHAGWQREPSSAEARGTQGCTMPVKWQELPEDHPIFRGAYITSPVRFDGEPHPADPPAKGTAEEATEASEEP